MKRWVNVAAQIAGLAFQFANALDSLVRPETKVVIAAALAFIQGAIAIIAHSYNVDGTPQTTPYVPYVAQDQGAQPEQATGAAMHTPQLRPNPSQDSGPATQ